MDVLYSHTVLYQPLIDCFGGMRHEDTSFEIGLGKDVGQCRGMVEMEAKTRGSARSSTQVACLRSRNGQQLSGEKGMSKERATGGASLASRGGRLEHSRVERHSIDVLHTDSCFRQFRQPSGLRKGRTTIPLYEVLTPAPVKQGCHRDSQAQNSPPDMLIYVTYMINR